MVLLVPTLKKKAEVQCGKSQKQMHKMETEFEIRKVSSLMRSDTQGDTSLDMFCVQRANRVLEMCSFSVC